MKRSIKKRSKKGFTLVEVMLATAIMAMCSVMIMNGFISTMNFAHNSSVYSRVGQTNYADAAARIAKYTEKAVKDGPRYTDLAADDAPAGVKTVGRTIKITGGPTEYKINSVNWRYTYGTADKTYKNGAGNTITLSENVVSNAGDSAYSEDSTYLSNRTAFFYLPKYNECDNCDSVGTVKWGRKGNTSVYHWYCTSCGYKVAD